MCAGAQQTGLLEDDHLIHPCIFLFFCTGNEGWRAQHCQTGITGGPGDVHPAHRWSSGCPRGSRIEWWQRHWKVICPHWGSSSQVQRWYLYVWTQLSPICPSIQCSHCCGVLYSKERPVRNSWLCVWLCICVWPKNIRAWSVLIMHIVVIINNRIKKT